MFKPLAMQYATIFLVSEDVAAASLALAESEAFNPQARDESEALPERPGEDYRALYESARGRLSKVLSYLQVESESEPKSSWRRPISEAELARTDERLGEIWRECSTCQQREQRTREQRRELEQLERVLEKYEALDIDLGLLHGGLQFLDLHIGSVAQRDVARLREAVGIIGYNLTVFMSLDSTAYVVVSGLKGAEHELRTVLNAASFRHLELPSQFRDRPTELRKDLDIRRQRINADEEMLRRQLGQARRVHGPFLREATETLALAAPYAQLAETLQGRGALVRISGWVPEDREKQLRASLAARLAGRFAVESRPPRSEEQDQVPTLVRYPWLFRPFAALVNNYGVPRYGELDPTWLFAITFVLMFGTMFGDIGQGLTISALGLIFRSRLKRFALFFVLAGLSSAGFGVIYGSVFGSEQIVHPLWMSPLSDPQRMLTLAVYWGAALILLATALTIYNRIVQHELIRAFLGGRGVAGAVLYVGLLLAAHRWMTDGPWSSGEQLLVFVPLILVAGYQWHRHKGGIGERIMVTLIETVETVISYLANTLSFLRIAAFSLNHVILAITVFTLADMMGAFGHWVVVILGNIFIIVLEGAIVGIQVLRLEYYEGFSRFFGGDGRPFRPLVVGLSPAQGR